MGYMATYTTISTFSASTVYFNPKKMLSRWDVKNKIFALFLFLEIFVRSDDCCPSTGFGLQ